MKYLFHKLKRGDENTVIEYNSIYCGDCLELMPFIEDDSIDLICTDLPYG